MPDPLQAMPASFAAGTSLLLRREFRDYPAGAGWSYSLYLRGVSALDATGTPDGDAFTVTIPATGDDSTATLAPGLYRWVERMELDGVVVDAATGIVSVTLDMAAAAAGAGQSHVERALAVIEARLEGRLGKDLESYVIAGRQVQHIPIQELEAMRSRYRWRLYQQQHPGQLGPTRLTRFAAP